MQLFDSIARHDLRPRRYHEPQFQYHNISARPPIHAIRSLLENWFKCFPADGKDDLRARFRSRINSQHRSAFFEPYVHQLLRCMSYKVLLHPPLEWVGTHPDFLVTRDAEAKFYMEVTATFDSEQEQAAEARTAEMYDKLNDLDSPNFFLGVRSVGAPSKSLPKSALHRKLEEWLRSLDPDSVAAGYSLGGQFPALELPFEGCRVTFEAIPKGIENRGRQGIRTIGMILPEVVTGNPRIEIRDAVSLKARKYKELSYPLTVAVNVMNECCHEIDIMDGLFGTEAVTESLMPDGTIKTHWNLRHPNGAWYGPAGPRNCAASAAIIVAQLSPWTLSTDTPVIVHNPWAKLSLELTLLPLPQYFLSDGRLRRTAGQSAKDLLGLPNPWPVPE